jgi:hypothetical protein
LFLTCEVDGWNVPSYALAYPLSNNHQPIISRIFLVACSLDEPFYYTILHSKRALVTVTLQLINLLLYPRNRQRRFQGYIIGDLYQWRFIPVKI